MGYGKYVIAMNLSTRQMAYTFCRAKDDIEELLDATLERIGWAKGVRCIWATLDSRNCLSDCLREFEAYRKWYEANRA